MSGTLHDHIKWYRDWQVGLTMNALIPTKMRKVFTEKDGKLSGLVNWVMQTEQRVYENARYGDHYKYTFDLAILAAIETKNKLTAENRVDFSLITKDHDSLWVMEVACNLALFGRGAINDAPERKTFRKGIAALAGLLDMPYPSEHYINPLVFNEIDLSCRRRSVYVLICIVFPDPYVRNYNTDFYKFAKILVDNILVNSKHHLEFQNRCLDVQARFIEMRNFEDMQEKNIFTEEDWRRYVEMRNNDRDMFGNDFKGFPLPPYRIPMPQIPMQ